MMRLTERHITEIVEILCTVVGSVDHVRRRLCIGHVDHVEATIAAGVCVWLRDGKRKKVNDCVSIKKKNGKKDGKEITGITLHWNKY